MIIIVFILILTWLNLGWPSWLVTRALAWSTPKSSFKTVIITTFIFALTWVNDQRNSWLRSYPGSILKSCFKTMIIIIFIIILTLENLGWLSQPMTCALSLIDSWVESSLINQITRSITKVCVLKKIKERIGLAWPRKDSSWLVTRVKPIDFFLMFWSFQKNYSHFINNNPCVENSASLSCSF